MSNSFERQTISFVVRVWAEPTASPQPQWRAQIEHVPSGEQVHIQISAALCEFLAAHLPTKTIPAESPKGEFS